MRSFTRTLLLGLLVLAVAALSASPAGANEDRGSFYWTRGSGTIEVQAPEECDVSALPTVLCTFATSSTTVGRHVGHGTSTGTGVATLDYSTSCTGAGGREGNPITTTTDSVIVAAGGSELHTHAEASGCFVDFGVGLVQVGIQTIVGGTGRFDGATGTQWTISKTTGGELAALAVGTIHL